MSDSKRREKRNHARLETSVHASEQLLCRLLRDAFEAKHARVDWSGGAGVAAAYPKLAASLQPIQRALLVEGDAAKWDLTLLSVILRTVSDQKSFKKTRKHVGKIVNVRNECAHAAGGRISDDAFNTLSQAVRDGYVALGGEGDAIEDALRDDDAFDVAATEEALNLKLEGNRAFAEQNYREARRIYSRAIDVDGVVDRRVLAELHNNRAAACKWVEDFDSAKADAKIAAKLAPTWCKPHVRIGELHLAECKHRKAASSFETALRVVREDKTGTSNNLALVASIERQLAAVRLLVDKDDRRESEDLAYDPQFRNEGAFQAADQAMAGLHSSQDPSDLMRSLLQLSLGGSGTETNPGLGALKYVANAHLALQDGRFHDAARGYLAAANAGSAERMYNYAIMLSNGRGVAKDVSRAAEWLMRAAAVTPTPRSLAKHLNVGIGEAMATLGRYYDLGIHFKQSDSTALEYWRKSAEMDVGAGLNSLALCYMNGSNGVGRNLAKARDLLRRSAEKLQNEAMTNLAVLHAEVEEFDTAARWAEAAATFGSLPAITDVKRFRQQSDEPEVPVQMLNVLKSIFQLQQNHWENSISHSARDFTTLKASEARAVGTPYAIRLANAAQDLDEAEALILQGHLKAGLDLAAKALRTPHAVGLLSDSRSSCFSRAWMQLVTAGTASDTTLAVFMALDSSEFAVEYARDMERRGEFEPVVFQTAAVAYYYSDPGEHPDGLQQSIALFQYAVTKVPNPERDSDPQTMQLLYDLANSYYAAGHLDEAATFAARFLKHALLDGHRLACQAHFVLGAIALAQGMGSQSAEPSLAARMRALEHLRDGLAVSAALPACFRESSKTSPQEMLEMLAAGLSPRSDLKLVCLPPWERKRRGGELLFGPRRHKLLTRSDADPVDDFRIVDKWRKKGAEYCQYLSNAGRNRSAVSANLQPPRASRPSQRVTDASLLKPTAVDELLSGLKDHVYEDKRLEAIVVAEAYFSGSSHTLIVEDSQREPMRVAIYNASESLMKQLGPGCSIVVLAPYLRITREGEIMIRVATAIRIEQRFAICWVCSLELIEGKGPSCSHCNVARYCSTKCMTRDWDVYGHKSTCSREAEKTVCSGSNGKSSKKKKKSTKKKKTQQTPAHEEEPQSESIIGGEDEAPRELYPDVFERRYREQRATEETSQASLCEPRFCAVM